MRKQQFEKLCAEHGITDMEIEALRDGSVDGQVWSPYGKVFNASGCHCCVHHFFTGGIGMVRQALAEDIKAGLTDCDDPECENCEQGES